jgi:hypothetical protein
MLSAKKPRKPVNPEKELRFTRSHQAGLFWGLATLFACGSAALFLASSEYLNALETRVRLVNSPLWGFLPILPALFFAWVAVHLTRHAFLILTPLGIEIFPFWKPKQNLQVLYWAEIASAEVNDDADLLVICLAGEGDSRVIISLDPIKLERRLLLKHAIEGRMADVSSSA